MMFALSAPAGSLVAGRDYPRTLAEFSAWFPDEAACLLCLSRVRWPEGFAAGAAAARARGGSRAGSGAARWRLGDGAHDPGGHAPAAHDLARRYLVRDESEVG